MADTIQQLDSQSIADAEDTLEAFLAFEFPSLDLSRGGVLHTLLLRPAAIYYVNNSDELDAVRDSMSLAKIAQDPSLADDDLVDELLSNLNLTRLTGSKATGQLALIMSEQDTPIVSTDVVFSVNDMEFSPTKRFIGVPSAGAVVDDSTRQVTQRADGNWEMVVDVQASDNGSDYEIQANTRLTSDDAISSNLLDIVAVSNFSGGSQPETTAELAARAQLGLSAKVLSGRTHIIAALQDRFSSIVDMTIVGMGDPEMQRSRHNIFAFNHGGKVDLYVRTRSIPDLASMVAEATLVDASEKIWQATFTRSQASGLYLFEAVVQENQTLYTLEGSSPASSLEIYDDIRQMDLTEQNSPVPYIGATVEGVYSSLQTVTVQFVDESTDTSGLTEGSSKRNYNFYYWQMPGLADIQDYVMGLDGGHPGADYLVKAPIPIFCAVSMTVVNDGVEDVDTDAVKTVVAQAVNGMSVGAGALSASRIIDAAHGALPTGAYIQLPIGLTGMTRKPSGEEVTEMSDKILTTPYDPDQGVSEDTSAFYLPVDRIDISVTE